MQDTTALLGGPVVALLRTVLVVLQRQAKEVLVVMDMPLDLGMQAVVVGVRTTQVRLYQAARLATELLGAMGPHGLTVLLTLAAAAAATVMRAQGLVAPVVRAVVVMDMGLGLGAQAQEQPIQVVVEAAEAQARKAVLEALVL